MIINQQAMDTLVRKFLVKAFLMEFIRLRLDI